MFLSKSANRSTANQEITSTVDRSSFKRSSMVVLKMVVVFCLIPCTIGVFISAQYIRSVKELLDPIFALIARPTDKEILEGTIINKIIYHKNSSPSVPAKVGKCYETFLKAYKQHLPIEYSTSSYPFEGISFMIHRNGESLPCGDFNDKDI